MTLAYITVYFSFLLEGIVSNYIPIQTPLFHPLFTVISLIVIYPFFYNQRKQYFLLAIIIGFLYDIAYTDTLFCHVLLFVTMALFIEKLNIWISNSMLNVAIMSLFTVIVYRILSFLILILIGYLSFSIEPLLRSIASSLILNMIYAAILYLLTDHWSQKKHVLKID